MGPLNYGAVGDFSIPCRPTDWGSPGDKALRTRKRRHMAAPVVRRYPSQSAFDHDRSTMTARGLHVASIGTDPTGEIRVVWSPHRRYSIERRDQREPV